jgi:hypothetical protein
MKFAEKIIRTFEHKPIDKVIFQPRIRYWYKNNKIPTLKIRNYQKFAEWVPEEYRGKKITHIYDDLNASIRYHLEAFPYPVLFPKWKLGSRIIPLPRKLKDDKWHLKFTTPIGSVSEIHRKGYILEHPIKKIEDIEIIKYIIEHSEYKYSQFLYNLAEKAMDNYGLPCEYYFRSPYMRCVLTFLGFERTIIWLRKYPREMEDFMQFLDEWDEKQYNNVITKSPFKWLNFGENIDHNLSPPPYFEKYLLEYYEKRIRKLHNANKIVFIHIDGSCKNLLPYLSEMSFDGYEALTPRPQGDVTVEEIRKSVGDTGKILLDLLPATLFMPQFSEERLIKETKNILSTFAPNLILGISDELCRGDGRRLKIVADIVEKFEY